MYKDFFTTIPENNSVIYDNFPEISLVLSNKKNSSDLLKTKMYLDNKKIKYQIHENKITYKPNKKLHSGKHYIKIITKDINKKSTTFQWSFSIKAYSEKCKYNFYYGIPHAHTSFSTGKGTPLEAFNYAYNKKLDFLIITDHSSYLCKKNKWDTTKDNALHFNKNHKFLALRGFEASSKGYGDFNIINTDSFYKYKIKDFKEFTYWLKEKKNPMVTINHPHKYIESFKYNKELDKFINFIEVGNGSLPYKYLNGEKYYYGLLDMGWHLGAVNGQDNHKMNFGDSDNLTAVICSSLKEKDFFEAINSRRTYSTETRCLNLTFKINNNWMGSILDKHCNKLNFDITAKDKNSPIKKIQIISNGGKVIKEKKYNKKTKLKWHFSLPYSKEKWYVVKVIHDNDKLGISSAIFT